MIHTTRKGESFDLEKDFSSPERHVLQKLIIWRDFAASVEAFREKKREALSKGWGDSGPVEDRGKMQRLLRDFEEEVARRLARGQEG
jgi:hypothetical protein